MVPFKLANIKCAKPLSPPLLTGKAMPFETSHPVDDVLALLTWPVGPTAPTPPGGIKTSPAGGFMFTLVTVVLSVTAKRVAVLVPWFEVQNGLVELCETPHGLTSSGSVRVASFGMSETKLT